MFLPDVKEMTHADPDAVQPTVKININNKNIIFPFILVWGFFPSHSSSLTKIDNLFDTVQLFPSGATFYFHI
jgi:hypothetical protein